MNILIWLEVLIFKVVKQQFLWLSSKILPRSTLFYEIDICNYSLLSHLPPSSQHFIIDRLSSYHSSKCVLNASFLKQNKNPSCWELQTSLNLPFNCKHIDLLFKFLFLPQTFQFLFLPLTLHIECPPSLTLLLCLLNLYTLVNSINFDIFQMHNFSPNTSNKGSKWLLHTWKFIGLLPQCVPNWIYLLSQIREKPPGL